MQDCRIRGSEKNCMECESRLIGRLAVSKAGRDKGTVLVITAVCEDGTVLVSDGRKRRLERPKRKKRKHLKLLKDGACFSEENPEVPPLFTNRILREAVRNAVSSMNRMEEGSFCRRTM